MKLAEQFLERAPKRHCFCKYCDSVKLFSQIHYLTIPPESLRPDDDFTGLFSNGEYNALITKNDEDEMAVVIVSAKPDKTGYEWTMSGYFSDENYRIRYSDAVKTVITYSMAGTEESRVTEYENGSGVIQFSDTNGFSWINNMEPIEKNEFKKAE